MAVANPPNAPADRPHTGLLALAGSALAAALLVALTAIWHAQATLQQQQARHGSTVAEQLAALAVEPLAADDRLRLDTLVDRFGTQPAIAAASIRSLDNRVLAEVAAMQPRRPMATAEVVVGGTVVAEVQLQVAADALTTPLPPLALVLAAAGAMAVLAATGIGWWWLGGSAIKRKTTTPGTIEAAAAGAGLTPPRPMETLDNAPIRLGIILLGLARWPAGLQARAVQALLAEVQPVAHRHGGQVASVSAGLLGRFPGSPDPAGGADLADAEAVHQAVLAALAMHQAMARVAGDLGLNGDDIRLGLHSDDDAALLLAAMANPGAVAVQPDLWQEELADSLHWQERRSAALAALGGERCILVSGVVLEGPGD